MARRKATRERQRISGDLAGERVVLKVVSGGANAELRIATDKTAATSQAATMQPPGIADPTTALGPRDHPVIMRALAEMMPNGISIARAGQTFLRAAVAADLRVGVVEQ